MSHLFGKISLFLLPRICLWLIAASIDKAILIILNRWPVSSNAYISFHLLAIYLLIGIVVGAIFLLLFFLLDRKGSLPRFSLSWDVLLIFLIVIGFRVNDIFLPAFKSAKSIGWNFLILLVSFAFWFLWRKLEGGKFRGQNFRAPLLIIFLASCAVLFAYDMVFWKIFESLNFGKRPDIVLITLDTVRADHLGCYGYSRNTSPNLDKFAKENFVSTSCRTPMPLTSPAHAALFSGKMPGELDVLSNISSYPEKKEYAPLAEKLSRKYYLTAAFPSAVHLSRDFNFDRGFLEYNESTVLNNTAWLQDIWDIAPVAIAARLGIIKQTYLVRDSKQVNYAVFQWLKRIRSSQNPFFVWIHYFDAHAPYQPPDNYWKQFDGDYQGTVTGSQEELNSINEQAEQDWQHGTMPKNFSQDDIDNLIARYDGEIAYLDENLGELLGKFQSLERANETVIIIVSDHGEGLYDNGYFGHNFTLREEEIRIVCIIKGPEIRCNSERPLCITDISNYVRYISEVDESKGRLTGLEEDAISESNPFTSMVFLREHCWIKPPYKLVRKHSVSGGIKYSLYNLEEDPDEKIDLSAQMEELTQIMRYELQQWLKENNSDFPDLLKEQKNLKQIDPATLEMLRSLGYIY